MTTAEKGKSGAGSPGPVPWAPWTELVPNSRFGQFLENAWRHGALEQVSFGEQLEETDDAYVLEFDLPGVAKKDVSIDVTGRRISVQATREDKERAGVLRHSTRTSSSFSYEVVLPSPVDEANVTATLDDGVLEVRVPKADNAKTTKIEIG